MNKVNILITILVLVCIYQFITIRNIKDLSPENIGNYISSIDQELKNNKNDKVVIQNLNLTDAGSFSKGSVSIKIINIDDECFVTVEVKDLQIKHKEWKYNDYLMKVRNKYFKNEEIEKLYPDSYTSHPEYEYLYDFNINPKFTLSLKLKDSNGIDLYKFPMGANVSNNFFMSHSIDFDSPSPFNKNFTISKSFKLSSSIFDKVKSIKGSVYISGLEDFEYYKF